MEPEVRLAPAVSRASQVRSAALEIATSPEIVRLALRTSLLVGSVLNLINQGDALLGTARLSWFKLGLTYIVPYCVATYSATSISLKRQRPATAPRQA